MIGAADRCYFYTLFNALAARDGAAMIAEARQMAANAVGFDGALHDLAALLQQIRIRENFRKLPAITPKDIIDTSINQTLARTMVTSLTTLLSVIALFLFGGTILSGFSTAMMIGIIFGTYSSIFVASAIVFRMGVRHEDLLPKSQQPVDDLP